MFEPMQKFNLHFLSWWTLRSLPNIPKAVFLNLAGCKTYGFHLSIVWLLLFDYYFDLPCKELSLEAEFLVVARMMSVHHSISVKMMELVHAKSHEC